MIGAIICPLIASSKGCKWWGVFVLTGFFFPITSFLIVILMAPAVKGKLNVPASDLNFIHEPVERRKKNGRCIYCGEKLESKTCSYCEQKNRYFKAPKVSVAKLEAQPTPAKA